MKFELTTYKIDQVNHLIQSSPQSPILKTVTLSISKNIELSEQNFGVLIETNQFQPDFFLGDTIVFSKKESEKALQNIYLFLAEDNQPIIGEMIHKPDAVNGINQKLEYRKARRKSFMTPTPLHIPTSQISPVADSSHERILIRPVGHEQQLVSISRQKSAYSFPMIFIYKKNT